MALNLFYPPPNATPTATIQGIEPYPGGQGYGQLGQSSLWIVPFDVPLYCEVSRGNNIAMMSLSSSSNSSHAGSLSFWMGIYTKTGSTLSLATSGSQSFAHTITSNTSTATYSGARLFSVPLSATMVAGNYWMAILSATATANANWFTASNMVVSGVNSQFSGPYGVATNATYQNILGLGSYSAQTGAMPASIPFSAIKNAGAAVYRSLPYFNAVNYTA